MTRPLRVNLLPHKDVGGGISRDVEVLRDALADAGPGRAVQLFYRGWRVRSPATALERWLVGLEHRLRKAGARLLGRPVFDLNLHLQSIATSFLGRARVDALVPNPEWLAGRDRRRLAEIDHVLCKTSHAVPIFEALGVQAREIGFTSRDPGMYDDLSRLEPRFLHVAGRSRQKGTVAVVEAWRRHPEWPELTVVQSPASYGGEETAPVDPPPNVRYLREWVAADALRELQQRHAFHVLPSEVEGFGHVLGEALAAGSVVVTTDAPPMNELVRPDYGVLVRSARSEPMRLGTRYFVDPAELDRQIEALLALPRRRWETMALRGRKAYESQHHAFRTRLHRYVQEVGQARRPSAAGPPTPPPGGTSRKAPGVEEHG